MRSRRNAIGRSSVSQGSDGRWHGYVSAGTDPASGQRRRIHVVARTEKAAWEKVASVERDRRMGMIAPQRGSEFEEWVNEWLAGVARSRRPSTVTNYRSKVTQYLLPAFGNLKLSQITSAKVARLYDDMLARGLSPTTVHNTGIVLSACLNEAVAAGRLGYNPASPKRARRPQLPRARATVLEDDEYQAVIDVLSGHRSQARWILALIMGPRQGEVLALKRSDFTPDSGMLRISKAIQRQPWRHGCLNPAACAAPHCKTESCPDPCARHTRACPIPCAPGCTRHARLCPQRRGGGLVVGPTKSASSDRVIVLPPALVDILAAHLTMAKVERLAAGYSWGRDGYLFSTPEGRPIDPRADWAEWKAILAAAGVRPLRVHDCRHHAGTTMMLHGIDTRTTQALMGWSSIVLSQRYQHPVTAAKINAAARLDTAVWGASGPPSSEWQSHAR